MTARGTTPVVALDLALMLPAVLEARVHALNAALAPPPDGFRFDETHVAHITLVQQFVSRARLPDLIRRVGVLLAGHPPLRLSTTGLTSGTTASTLGIASTRSLAELHRRLADLVHPLAASPDAAAFAGDDPPRPADVAWVASFREQSSYERFAPHVTLGIGRLKAAAPFRAFTADTVALYRLGRFCTCRARLASWTLTASRR